MTIIRPTSQTVISTTQWGWPITDEVNRLTGLVDGRTPTPWVSITSYLNGWVAHSGGVAYRKIGDIVYLRGNCKSGNDGVVVFSLPSGFRPIATVELIGFCYLNTWTYININVNTDGTVSLKNTDNRTGSPNNVSFWNIQFPTT